MTINEIKKDLYRSKEKATFSYYSDGKLYYNVVVAGELYEFPIHVVEKGGSGLKLASDLGTTRFFGEMEGRHLNKWIEQAIDAGEFIKLTE